jgi:hypothetical protein
MGPSAGKKVSMYLVLTCGELKHLAIKETLLFPSMASSYPGQYVLLLAIQASQTNKLEIN